jgi:hypothetical protein
MNRVLTAATTMSMTVMIAVSWPSRSARGPGATDRSWPAVGKIATTPVTATAMLTALSAPRSGRRAISRMPSRSGTGSSAEIASNSARRRGGRASSASACTVLSRAARRAGTSVAATATATAIATGRAIVAGVSVGAPGAPTSPAPADAITGVSSRPAIVPRAAVLGGEREAEDEAGAGGVVGGV